MNHKKVERLYREEGLSLQSKRRRKRGSQLRVALPLPQSIDQHWSMDFVMDSLFDGRRFRALTVLDNLMRESVAIEVERSLTGRRVVK